jgi:hypothetical protein
LGRWRHCPKAEEERDDTVLRCGGEGQVDGAVLKCGDGMEAVGMAAVWTQQRRRGHRKFWWLDGVQVKIFRLGFKDRGLVVI